MEETFGSELDRMAVPVARNLSMTLQLLQPVEVLGTWGYENRVAGRVIHYSQENLHHRDYETILAQIRILSGVSPGTRELARFTIDYEDLEGNSRRSGPHTLTVEFVDMEHPVAGLSSGLVLKSGTMLRFAQSLKTIGELYYSCTEQIDEINRRRDELWRRNSNVSYDELASPELRVLEEVVAAKMRRALDITVAMKKEVANARLRLDNEGFDDEIEILDRYIEILGAELEWEQARLTTVKGDLEMAMVEFGRIDTMTVVERDKLDLLLTEQELALSDLMDTGNAVTPRIFLDSPSRSAAVRRRRVQRRVRRN